MSGLPPAPVIEELRPGAGAGPRERPRSGRLLDVRADSPSKNVQRRLVLGDGASRLVRIPPGVAHGVKNLGQSRGRIIYFVDTQFSPAPASM